jgi:hypothetical protein
MKKNLFIFVGIFLSLAATRLIPHPPNFTSLLALSFYVPALLGIRYLPLLIISFAITDLIIGYHFATHWTWGSVLIIGFLPMIFSNNIFPRIIGALTGAVIFYIITNFGIWTNGSYGYSWEGLIICFTLAIPFFTYSLLSTLLFSIIIEIFYSLLKTKVKKYI